MKNTLLLMCLAFNSFAFGQIELEHTYDESTVTRINLEYSGEKYYLFKKATNELVFYNDDHSYWKTIVIDAPPETPFTATRILHVSEAVINPDINIEIGYSYPPNFPQYQFDCRIMSENGNIILDIPYANEMEILDTAGVPDKIITRLNANDLFTNNNSSKVFSLQGLVLENFYNNGLLHAAQLENIGRKYFLLDKAASDAKIYNEDHSIWKIVLLPKPANANYKDINAVFMDSGTMNVNIGYTYYIPVGSNAIFTGIVVDENSVELLSVPNSSSMYISNMSALPSKLIATIQTSGSSGLNFSSNVYHLDTFALEHVYESQIKRISLENSGEKYYTCAPYNSQVEIYNADHTLWKTIPLTVPETFFVYDVNDVTENKFNTDDLVELDYSIVSTALEAATRIGRVINENNVELLSIYGPLGFYLSEISGLETKLIATMEVPSFDEGIYYSEIYRMPNMATKDFESNTKIALLPIPASFFLDIYSSISVTEVEIYNSNGMIVEHIKANNIEQINVSDFPTGMYFVKINDVKGNFTYQKVLVSH